MYKLAEERTDVWITKHSDNDFTYEQFILGRRMRPFMHVWQTASNRLWTVSARIGDGNLRKDWNRIERLSYEEMKKVVKDYLKDGSPCLR